MIPFRGLVASGNCWREGQYVRWTKVNFKVLHAAPVQGSHGAFWLAKSSVVVHCKNTCIAQEFLHEKKNFKFHKKQGYTLRDCTTRKPLNNKLMRERARKNAGLMIDFKRVKVGTTECKEKLLVLKIDLSDMTRVSEKAYFFF